MNTSICTKKQWKDIQGTTEVMTSGGGVEDPSRLGSRERETSQLQLLILTLKSQEFITYLKKKITFEKPSLRRAITFHLFFHFNPLR